MLRKSGISGITRPLYSTYEPGYGKTHFEDPTQRRTFVRSLPKLGCMSEDQRELLTKYIYTYENVKRVCGPRVPTKRKPMLPTDYNKNPFDPRWVASKCDYS